MKDVEKYIGYYLLAYLATLAICGFIQYFATCQGKSLECIFDTSKINTIISTTASVVTPIVSIIGFQSWKKQHNKLMLAEEAKKLLLAINDDIKLFTDISGYLRFRDNSLKIKDYRSLS